MERIWDCYYNYYTGSASFNSLSTLNTSVATANLGSYEVQGVNPGETDVVGDYQYVYWEDDGMNCYQRYDNGSNTAPVDVTPHIDSISPAASAVGHGVTVSISGKGFAQGATINAGSGITVDEITVSSGTSMSATFSVAANATAGNRDVTVAVNGKTSNSKSFTVQVPDRLVVVSDTGNLPLPNCPSVIFRLITYQVADSSTSHSSVAQAIWVQEFLDNQTTNTCGNGQPDPASCELTDSSGQFIDGISITCASTALANCSSNPSCGYEYTQRWLTCSQDGSIELDSVAGITHCNQIKINNSTQLTPGTLMPK